MLIRMKSLPVLLGGLILWFVLATPVMASDDLREACRTGDLGKVREALKDKADPNATDKQGSTALHLALTGRHFLVARLILDAGADPAKKDGKGRNALAIMQASRRAPLSANLKDIKKWVDVNVTRDICNLLHYADLGWQASEKEDIRASSGLMMVIGMAQSQTPVPAEEMQKAHEIAAAMLRKSRAPAFAKLATNSGDRAVLMAEIAYGTKDDRTLLVRHLALSKTGRKSQAPKPPKAKEGATVQGKRWLEMFCSHYAKPDFGDFTVFAALTMQQKKEKLGVDVLDELCRDYPVMALRAIHYRNADGITELHGLCAKGTPHAVRLLLSHGANPNAITCSKDYGGTGQFANQFRGGRLIGLTPLHVACMFKQKEMVEALLDFGADPDIQIDDGRSALHFAAAEGEESIVKMLLQQGASKALKDNKGKTPLDLATRANVQRLLKEK